MTKEDEMMEIALRNLRSAAESDYAWYNLQDPHAVLNRMQRLINEAKEALEDDDVSRAMRKAVDAGGTAVAGYVATYFR